MYAWGALRTQESKMITRVVRGRPADRSFDIDFWQQQGDEAIFAAAWEMVLMAEEFRHGRRPTFQRTVTNIQRKQS
jgi:hypothetical protein